MFTEPIKNLKALGLREDSVVADLGAGTGFYAVAAGHIVSKGKVYAVEIVKDFLETIKNKVKDARISNVEIIWGNVEKIGGTKIGDGVIDSVIASNILFQVEDKNTFIEETKRILKPRGSLLLVDWSTEAAAIGFKQAIAQNQAREMFEKKGFIWQRDINAGVHHYGMIFVRA